MGWLFVGFQIMMTCTISKHMNNYFGNNQLPQSDAEMICDMLIILMGILTTHTAAMVWHHSLKKTS